MKIKQRRWVLILGVFFVFITIGCGHKKSLLEPFNVAIAYIPNMQFTPFYVALEKGYFREAGLEITIDYGFSADVIGLVAGGMASAALADADQFLVAQQVLPVSAFFQYYSTLPMAILSTREGLFTPNDLSGKTFGVSELFGSSYLALRAFMQEQALDDITIERIGYTQLLSLERGLVDAAVVYANNEPLVLHNAGIPFTLWRALQHPIAGSVLVSARPINTSDVDKLQRFALALQRGMQFTIAHPEEAAQVAIGYIDGAEFEPTLQGIQATIPYFSLDNVVDMAMLTQTQRLLQELDLLSITVNPPFVLNVF